MVSSEGLDSVALKHNLKDNNLQVVSLVVPSKSQVDCLAPQRNSRAPRVYLVVLQLNNRAASLEEVLNLSNNHRTLSLAVGAPCLARLNSNP